MPTSLLICVQFISQWEATQIWRLWCRHKHQAKFWEFIYEKMLTFDFNNFMCVISLYIIILKFIQIPWPDAHMNNLECFYHVSFFYIVCRETFKHIFLKRQVKFIYTNIYTSPTHKKSISDDSIPSLKPTYCSSSLGYSAQILFMIHKGITLLTPLTNLTCTNQQNCL